MRRLALALAIGAWAVLAALAEPAPAPLLCVLSEHFDAVCTFVVDEPRAALTPAAAPMTVRAPHDAVFAPGRRVLYLAAEYDGRPCVLTYDVSPQGAMKRRGDPIPTVDRDPQLILMPGERWLYAWSPKHLQAFPLDAGGQPQVPHAAVAGCEGIVQGAKTYVLQGGRLSAHGFDADSGALTPPLAAPLPAGFGASSLAMDPAGRQLFSLTLDDFDKHVRVFDVAADGLPHASEAPRPITLREAQRKLVCTDRFAYLLNVSSTVSVYARADGTLTQLGRPVPSASGLHDLLVLGKAAFAVGTSDPSIWCYRVKDGVLSPARPVDLPKQAAGTRVLLLR